MKVDQRIIDMVSVEEGMTRPKSSSSFSRFRGLRFRVLGASFSRYWVLRFRDIGVFAFDLGVFVFEFWKLRFRDLGASFSSFGCFVFEIWVLRFRVLGASCFGLRFRVLRFRNYRDERDT